MGGCEHAPTQYLMEERLKKVAIVALGPSSQHYIQMVDAAGDRKKLFDETWTFNTYASLIESDRIFHMDDFKVQEARAVKNERVAGMLEALKRYKNPIYTSFPEPEYPTSEAYPIKEVIEAFGSMYFTSTPPYALAYAMLRRVEEVAIFGADYTYPGVAGCEDGRACLEYWIGRAQQMGMRVLVSERSTLLGQRERSNFSSIPMYGFDRVQVGLIEDGENRYKLRFTPKALPSVEEIEKRYSHRKAGSELVVDVVN